MQRYLSLAIAVVAGVGGLSAGTIQTQINLSASALGSTNEDGWNLKNYDNYLFVGANNGSPTVPYTGYQQTAAASGTLTTGGETFNMINSGCGGTTAGAANACNGTLASNNVWVAPVGSGPTTITIPIGIYDVSDVYTMLSNYFGQPGVNDTDVIFNWGTTATNANGPSLTVALTNASNNASANSGQIGSGVDCTVPGGVGTSNCYTMALGGLATGPTTISGISVVAGNVFSQSYNSTIGGNNSAYSGSTGGKLTLDDQGFLFNGLNSSYYLVNVEVEEMVGVSANSATALSAITVDSVTPEPSTVWLGIGGLIAAVFFVRRRRAA